MDALTAELYLVNALLSDVYRKPLSEAEPADLLNTVNYLRHLNGIKVQKVKKQPLKISNEDLDIKDIKNFGIVVTDEQQVIEYYSNGFSEVTGYGMKEMIGKNCRILQGDGTKPGSIKTIRYAMTQSLPCQIRLINYRKDGSPFWNNLSITPIFDIYGNLQSYVGILNPAIFIDRPLKHFPWISENSLQNQKSSGIVTQTRIPRTASNDLKINEVDAEAMFRKQPIPGKFSFIAETNLPTVRGVFRMRAYRDSTTGSEPIAMIHGDVSNLENVILRVHDQCFTSEVIGSLKCDCREQLHFALEYIKKNSPGIVIYLQQEGRGMGLANKVKAYSLQEHGFDTVDANVILGFEDDTRDYSCIPYILNELRVKSVRLMTNNPRKIDQLSKFGINIASRIPVIMKSNTHSDNYLKAKTSRMGHMINTALL